MTIAEAVLLLFSLLIATPILVLAIEVFAACAPGSSRRRVTASLRPSDRIAILIPAHNEEIGITRTIASILPQLRSSDRLIVIADNCTDATAHVARSAGAHVLERSDTNNRGKGYALAAGVEHLMAEPPDALLIVDADTPLAAGAVETLAQTAAASGQPVQAAYLLSPEGDDDRRSRISAFAFRIKNLARPMGARACGVPVHLTGSGMAFPWSVISHANVATGNIVEDMQLGIDLAIAGHPPVFCPDAVVTGRLPGGGSAARTQRTRWEHGHLQTIRRNVPRLLWEAIRQARPSLIALALDVAVPPLALLLLLWSGVLGLTAMAYATDLSSATPLFLVLALGLVFALSILLAWARFARGILPVRTLLSVPLYILWKLPLYAAYLIRPQKAWVRTARAAETVK